MKIKEEVKKQFDAGCLAVAWYPEWVANIVPVPKKDGKVRMCVDYRDLNRASPKDNFPLFLHGWVLRLQLDKNDAEGYGKDYLCHPMGDVLLQGDVLWAQKR